MRTPVIIENNSNLIQQKRKRIKSATMTRIMTVAQMVLLLAAVVTAFSTNVTAERLVSEKYFGTPLGPLVGGPATGQVYIVDETTLFIRQFTLPGVSYPLSYFMAGATVGPDGSGFIVPDERSSTRQLSDYNEKDILLRLPEGRTVRDIRWLSIWNRHLHTNLGHVQISSTVSVPNPLELPPLTSLAHGVRSGPITVIDAQTILVPDFWYDGAGPAAYWWVSRGDRQTPQGLRLKDENGTPNPLRPYNGETFLITLPETKTIYDFDWFGVYCEEFQVDFGNVRLPQHVRVPPSPRMLNIKPETKLNCEVLDDGRGFEVRWIMDGDDIVMQLVGRLQPREYMALALGKDDRHSLMAGADAAVAWIDDIGNGHAVDYHLGSKEQCVGNRGSCPDLKHEGATDSITLLHAAVINGFSMVTFKRPQLGVDEIYDQHIYSDGQQSILWAIGPLNQRNEVSFHSGLRSYGDRYVDFARTPSWNCPRPDESLLKQQKWQRLIAAATSTTTTTNGGSGITTTMSRAPSTLSSMSDPSTTLAATSPAPSSLLTTATSTATPSPMLTTSTNSLSTLKTSESVSKPWQIPMIKCPRDRKLWAQIGPVGGARGYRGITGRQGWGIAWYINGLMIPELVLKRGVTYTFFVEGGNDDSNGARRHPLYLTDSAEGGFEFKTSPERRSEHVFGGVGITDNGTILPTAVGRLCEWKITPATNLNDIDGTYERFEDFHRTLAMSCDQSGKPGMIRFTPDSQTPDLLYYQCYTHRYLGWKIHVVDDCDETDGNLRGSGGSEDDRMLHSAAASMMRPMKAAPPPQMQQLAPSGEQRRELKKRQQNVANNNNQNNGNKRHQLSQNHSLKPRQPQPLPRPQALQQQQQRQPQAIPFHSNRNPQPQDLIQSLNLLNLIPQAYHRSPGNNPNQIPLQIAQQGPMYFSQGPMHNQPQPLNHYTQRPPNFAQYPSTPAIQFMAPSSLAPSGSQPQPSYQLFPFGPASSLKKYGLYQQRHQQQQRPNLGNSGNQLQPQHHRRPNPHPQQHPTTSKRFQVNPLRYSGPSQQQVPPKTMQGGFVPVSLESTNNRIPILGNAKTQNVWFPSKHGTSGSTQNFQTVITTVPAAASGTSTSASPNFQNPKNPKNKPQQKKPAPTSSLYYQHRWEKQPASGKPTNDIYRIVPNVSSSTTTSAAAATTQTLSLNKLSSATVPLLTTTVSIDATTLPMDWTIRTTTPAPSTDRVSLSIKTSGGDGGSTSTESSSTLNNNFQNGWIDDNGEAQNSAEESQKRFVFTENGIMSIKDATSLSGNNYGYYGSNSANQAENDNDNDNGKPLTIYSLMENSEKMASIQNQTDHTILSDVLRMIAQNVPISSSITGSSLSGTGPDQPNQPSSQNQQSQQQIPHSYSYSYTNRPQQQQPNSQQQSNQIPFRFN